MPNHIHLMLQGRAEGLSRLSPRLDAGHALSFNRRHQRSGYLFQNLLKSRVVEDHADLMNLVIDTHRNPLVGGIVASAAELEQFPRFGHGALVGSVSPRRFEPACRCSPRTRCSHAVTCGPGRESGARARFRDDRFGGEILLTRRI